MLENSIIKELNPIRVPEYMTEEATAIAVALLDNCLILEAHEADGMKFRYVINKEGSNKVYLTAKKCIKSMRFENALRNYTADKKLTIHEDDLCVVKNYLSEILERPADSVRSLMTQFDLVMANKKAKANRDKKEAEIDAVMEKIKEVPKSFEKTVAKSVDHNFLFFNRKEKTGVCTLCGSTVSVDKMKFKEKDYGKCPECGKKVQYLSHTRAATKVVKGMSVLVQAYGERSLVVRYFNVTATFSNYIPKISSKEVIRTIIDFNKREVTDYEWYFFNGHQRWCYPQKSMFCPDGIHYKFLEGKMHDNFKSELKKASLDKIFSNYSEIMKYIRNKEKNNEWSSGGKLVYGKYIRYIELLLAKPYAEQLSKAGLYEIVYELYVGSSFDARNASLNKEEESAKKIIGVTKQQFAECVKNNISLKQLSVIQLSNKSGIIRNFLSIMDIYEDFGYNKDVFAIPDKRISKIKKYLLTQNYDTLADMMKDYLDYLRIAEKELGYNMKSGMILYPYSLKNAHDLVVTEIKSREKEKEYEMIKPLLPAMHDRYDYAEESYIIVAPNDGKDITYEGQALNHCVNSYVGKVAAGKTAILFIRQADKPDKPFVTMEVNRENNHIVQVRGFGNGKPSDEVWEFVNRFKAARNIA